MTNEIKLIAALEEYQQVLLDELDSLVGMAHVHGWRSNNVERGKECRAKIAELKTPASDPSTQEELEAKKDQLWDEFLYDVGSRMNFLTGQTGPDHPEKMRAFLEGKWDIEIKRKNLKS